MFSRREGFTLFEIMLTVVVMGIIALLAIPKIRQRKSVEATAKAVTEEINNLVYFARHSAITKRKIHRLHFVSPQRGADFVYIEIDAPNPEKPNEQKFEPLAQYSGKNIFSSKYTLPENVKFEAVFHGKQEELEEKKRNAFCHIIPDGLVEEVLVHISLKESAKDIQEKIVSLRMLPFFGKFELIEDKIKPEK